MSLVETADIAAAPVHEAPGSEPDTTFDSATLPPEEEVPSWLSEPVSRFRRCHIEAADAAVTVEAQLAALTVPIASLCRGDAEAAAALLREYLSDYVVESQAGPALLADVARALQLGFTNKELQRMKATQSQNTQVCVAEWLGLDAECPPKVTMLQVMEYRASCLARLDTLSQRRSLTLEQVIQMNLDSAAVHEDTKAYHPTDLRRELVQGLRRMPQVLECSLLPMVRVSEDTQALQAAPAAEASRIVGIDELRAEGFVAAGSFNRHFFAWVRRHAAEPRSTNYIEEGPRYHLSELTQYLAYCREAISQAANGKERGAIGKKVLEQRQIGYSECFMSGDKKLFALTRIVGEIETNCEVVSRLSGASRAPQDPNRAIQHLTKLREDAGVSGAYADMQQLAFSPAQLRDAGMSIDSVFTRCFSAWLAEFGCRPPVGRDGEAIVPLALLEIYLKDCEARLHTRASSETRVMSRTELESLNIAFDTGEQRSVASRRVFHHLEHLRASLRDIEYSVMLLERLERSGSSGFPFDDYQCSALQLKEGFVESLQGWLKPFGGRVPDCAREGESYIPLVLAAAYADYCHHCVTSGALAGQPRVPHEETVRHHIYTPEARSWHDLRYLRRKAALLTTLLADAVLEDALPRAGMRYTEGEGRSTRRGGSRRSYGDGGGGKIYKRQALHKPKVIPTDVAETDLWAAFKCQGDLGARNELLGRYLSFIHNITAVLSLRLPEQVDPNDLLQEGVLGVMDAMDAFDPSMGKTFKQFSYRRIRGRMLDSLREDSWHPRTVIAATALVDRAIDVYLQKHDGWSPTPEDLYVEMNALRPDDKQLSHEQLSRVRLAALRGEEQSLQSLSMLVAPADGSSRGHQWYDILPDPSDDGQIALAARDPSIVEVSDRIGYLAPYERRILWLYYVEEKTMKEIGAELGLSESRISQIHSVLIGRAGQSETLRRYVSAEFGLLLARPPTR